MFKVKCEQSDHYSTKINLWVISRTDFMGHFDILLFQTPQDFLETALETGAGDCFAGPGMLPGAPGRPLHLLLVDTLGEGLHHGLQLIALRVEGLLFLTSSIATPQNQKSRHLMLGDLAGQAMVVRREMTLPLKASWSHPGQRL